MGKRLLARLGLALTVAMLLVPGVARAGSPLFQDGFESGTTDAWSTEIGDVAVDASGPHAGVYAARATAAGQPAYVSTTLPTRPGEVYARLWFRVVSRTTSTSVIRLTRADRQLFGVGLRADGRMFAKNSFTATTATSSSTVVDDGWHELEVHVSTGSDSRADVWLDGAVVSDLGGPAAFGSGGVAGLRVGEDVRDRSSVVLYDDVAVATTFIEPADHAPPTTPASIRANAVNSRRVDVSWAPSTDDVAVAGYTVYRDGASIGTTVDAFYSDSGVYPSTTYVYTVDAFDAAGHRSDRSDAATVDVPEPDVIPPEPPTELAGTASAPTTVMLTWSAATDDRGVTGYAVYRDGGVAPLATTTGTEYTDTSATPDTSHVYAVEAFDAEGNHSAPSDPATVQTPADSAPPTAPAALVGRAVSSREVDLSWSASSDDVGVDGYTVYRDGAEIGITSATSFVDTSVRPATRVVYVVDAFDAKGFHSSPSNAATVDVPDDTPPSTPAAPGIDAATDRRVDLSWAASTDDVAVDGYTVYRNAAAIGTSRTPTYSDVTVRPSTTYRYRVDAVDAAGNHSAKSAATRVATAAAVDDTPPSTPAGLQTTSLTPNRVDLDWSSSTDAVGVAGYTVYRDGVQLDTTGSSNYADASVAPGTTYRYRVDAFDAAGNHSGESDAVVVDVPRPSASAVVMAAGDIACDPSDGAFNGGAGTSGSCRQRATSDLLVAGSPDAVLALGDNQYNCGGLQAYRQSFDLSWGRLKAITYPVAGNHEYDGSGGTNCASGAAGYFQYFGSRAGPVGKGWYSFDVGAWHLVALNSECSRVGGCGAGSPQERWLKADLAANPAECTLAFWHRPRYGPASSDDAGEVDALWDDLVASHADLVLSGHVHAYARLKPLGASGQVAADGIRSFVVGTGGKSLQGAGTARSIVDKVGSDYGVLRLTLRAGAYDWQFVHAAGENLTDSGSGVCH